MAELLDTIRNSIGPDTIERISDEIGADQKSTATAISAVLPAMIGGLSRNAHEDQGASELSSALEKDHDGSILGGLGSGGLMEALGGLLSGKDGGTAGNAQGILGHIFGNKQESVEEGAARASGLDRSQSGRLMAMLAPIVMGALGKLKREKNLSPAGVKDLLEKEENQLESKLPATEQGGLRRFLDSNRDGKVDLSDDVAKVGMALGAAFLLSRGRQRR